MPKGIRKTPEEKAADAAAKEVEKAAKAEAKAKAKAEKEALKNAENPNPEPEGEKINGGLEVPDGTPIEVMDSPRDPSKFDPNAKVDVVNPRDLSNYYVRTYSDERHGPKYLELASVFAADKGYEVIPHDKTRLPGFRPATPAQSEVPGLEK